MSDKKLAALQFAFALSSEGGGDPGAPAARRARELVRENQEPDGSFAVDSGGLAGSPVTYGRTLATVAARRVLSQGGPAFREALARADGWLRERNPVTVLDAAALLMGSAGGPQRDACLGLIRKGEAPGGGWGPYVASPPEIFDTAVVLLGLAELPGDEGRTLEMRRRGRRFLVDSQRADGSWPETTRPPGGESYAQRISTTAWATLALLAVP